MNRSELTWENAARFLAHVLLIQQMFLRVSPPFELLAEEEREEFTSSRSKRPRTVSVSEGRGPQSGCSRRGRVLGRTGGKRDSKCCHRAD